MSSYTNTANKRMSGAPRETVYLVNEVDPSKFKFGKVEINKYGGKSVRVSYNGNDFPFLLQLPRVRMPFGLGKYQDENSPIIKYSMDFSLAGYELNDDGNAVNPKMRQFYELMVAMKDSLVQGACANSQEWLGVKKDKAKPEFMEMMVRDPLRFSVDKKTGEQLTQYAPTMKAKVRQWENKFMVKAFDGETKESLTDLETSIPKGSEAIPILRLNSVTLAGGKCGYQWEVTHIRVFRPARVSEYAFIDDDGDNQPVQSALKDVEVAQPKVQPAPAKFSNQVEDSDEDEEDEEPQKDELDADSDEEDDDERPPTPPPAKKVVKKTVTAPKKK